MQPGKDADAGNLQGASGENNAGGRTELGGGDQSDPDDATPGNQAAQLRLDVRGHSKRTVAQPPTLVVALEQGGGALTAAPVAAKILDYYFGQRTLTQAQP